MTGERRRKVRIVLAGGLALVLAGAIVAVIGEGDNGGTSDEASTVMSAPASPGAVVGGPGESGAAPATGNGRSALDIARPVPSPSGPAKVDPVGPKIVRTGELAIRVAEGRFTTAFDRVASIASVNGGFVVSSSMVTQGEDTKKEKGRPQAGDVVLRVPADRFDAARQALSDLGTVERASLRGEDVSGQLIDYEARLRSLNAQEEALRQLMARATAVAEVIQVQSSLFDVRQQIEQLTAQRDQLNQAAALSTLQVSLYEPGAAFVPEPEPTDGLARSFDRAVDAAVDVIGGMIVVLGWLTPIAVLVLIGWGVSRLRHRRPRASAPAVSAPAAS